jgi:hypothetical protein
MQPQSHITCYGFRECAQTCFWLVPRLAWGPVRHCWCPNPEAPAHAKAKATLGHIRGSNRPVARGLRFGGLALVHCVRTPGGSTKREPAVSSLLLARKRVSTGRNSTPQEGGVVESINRYVLRPRYRCRCWTTRCTHPWPSGAKRACLHRYSLRHPRTIRLHAGRSGTLLCCYGRCR